MIADFSKKASALACAIALCAATMAAVPSYATEQVTGNYESFFVKAKAGPGQRGWQGNFVYTPTPGAGGVFFHYPCPRGAPIAVNGGYQVNAAGIPGFNLIGNFSRQDQAYGEWGWDIRWSGTAPSGTQITFNVYCLKRNPTE